MKNRSSGFVLVGVMIAAVLAIVIVGGYLYYSKQMTHDPSRQTTDATPTTYSSPNDLDQAADSLDNTDVNADLDTSLKQLDADVNNF